MARLDLTADERDMAAGLAGPGVRSAMAILTRYAEAVGAPRLLPITAAHIDGCLYHGPVGLDFVAHMREGGGTVRVPTTLNVGSIDLIHPGLVRGPEEARAPARALMEAHLALGCAPSFTCAPYATAHRPHFGDQIAWGESNAIVFANSVIGARTNRYGDFIDLACAMTGRAPAYGLHLDENRAGEMRIVLDDSAAALDTDALCVGLGAVVGWRSGARIPVIEGLPPASEDQLKALGAVAASAGSVGLFHVVGQTPEAETAADAFQGDAPMETIRLTRSDIEDALTHLSTAAPGTPIQAVSLGTPHYSIPQLRTLDKALVGWRPASGVSVYVNAGRETWEVARREGIEARLEAAGVTCVSDTCLYVTAMLDPAARAVMTDSGKLAHYAPANLGVEVAFGTLRDCLASAAEGRLVRSATL
ncbi:MAG: aconitase X catalytic domain-containing protein [Pseudomonadota bacterium]